MSSSPFLWSFAFILAVALGAPPLRAAQAAEAGKAAVAKRPMTPEDLWALERVVGDPALSPDGHLAVIAVTRSSVAENKGDSDLWLVQVNGSAPPRRITWNKGSDSAPAWSPDGRRIAFVSKRGDGPPQLYLLPVGGGEAEPLTDLPVAVQDPKWFPDGRRIAFLASTWPDLNGDWAAVKKRQEERKADKTQARISSDRVLRFWDDYRTDGTRLHLFVVDLASRKVTDLTPGLAGFMDFMTPEGTWDIAPDGQEIAFSANSSAPPFQTMNVDVWTVSLAGDTPGAPKNLTAANPASDGTPRYSPEGGAIVFARNRRPEIEPEFSHLARYDRKTGEIRDLAADWDSQPQSWSFTPDGKTLLVTAQDRGRVHLYALDVDGGKPRVVVKGGVIGTPSARSAGGAEGSGVRLVFSRRSLFEPAELATLTLAEGLAGGTPRPLTSWNAERMAQLDLGTSEDITFEGGGGDPVHMFVLYPPGFDPGRKWPLVQLIHGGPHGAFLDELHARWNAALFSARGYVVAMVNFHGSTGYGEAFAESILGSHGDLPFADIMKATDHLIARGFIDEKKMAAAGGSYGGYLVAWILGHTDRFAALVDHAGVYDLMGQFASDDTYGRPNNYGANPWEDPARIDRWSPSRYAANFKTPTLILHGEKDYRVPVTQGINLYGVLQAKGVPSRIVIFPDENHWVLKPQASLLWWQEVFAWLDRYLGSAQVASQGS
jgi:dipeptidyl aminopeptidase/acylaminoacyl peptidase